MINKYIACIGVVIVMVCSLSFCEEPMHVQEPVTIIKKQPPPAPKPETHAEPEGMSGLF